MTVRIDSARRIGAVLLVALVAFASWFRPLDSGAGAFVDQGLKAAFAAFATARILNGAISLIQSGQVGVGVSVRPGEMLDPINDLIEQFADFMLAATVAFGAQKVLLEIGAHWLVPLLLSVTALTWAVWAAWTARDTRTRPVPRWLLQAFAVLLALRFAVPVAALGTDLLTRVFLASTQEAAQRSLDAFTGGAAPPAAGAPPGAGPGMLERLKDWLSKGADLGAQVDRFTNAAGQLASDVSTLTVVFLFQTLVFPLAILWLLFQWIRTLFRPRPPRTD
jgi:hypothetical protein